jgi:hypothetical protein
MVAKGPPPVSERLKAEFLRREQTFFSDPHKAQKWEAVREEFFGE